MTMAATSPTDSNWTQKSMRPFSLSPAWHRIRDLAGFQIKTTASLLSHCLSSSSRCATHSSSCHAGWLLRVSPLNVPPLCVASQHAALSSSWLIVASSSLVVLSLHRPLVISSCSARRRQGAAGRQAAQRRQRAARQ
jgi:hypothetical protein